MIIIYFAGWVRFKLNQAVVNAYNTPTDETDVSDWTNAFYLTRVDKVRAILDCGQPLPTGNVSNQTGI